jgi:hypothetical protein
MIMKRMGFLRSYSRGLSPPLMTRRSGHFEIDSAAKLFSEFIQPVG